MARTFTCNEEIIVVSKGTEDIGKLAMLGNGGKFDPSVIPEIPLPEISAGIPAGAVMYFATLTAPEGWLIADGSEISRIEYAKLFSAIGVTFGSGDGNTTFTLPDMRGEFVRGLDNGRGIDSDRVLGSNQKGTLIVTDGTKTVNNAVSLINADDNQNLMNERAGLDEPESISDYQNLNNAYGVVSGVQSVIANSANFRFGVSRPRNIALLACIKY